MLGWLQDRGGVVVVIEDLHWADAVSAAVLLFVLRRLQGDRG